MGKRASVSSVYKNAYPASHGVDGNITSFFHTDNESNPWWIVDLGSVFNIAEVHVYNRVGLYDGNVTFV